MAHFCAFCDLRIRSPESLKICLEAHEQTDPYEALELHLACPCPIHRYEAEFRYPD